MTTSEKFSFSVSVFRDAPNASYKRYIPCFIPRNPRSNGLVRFKISDKWMGIGRGPSGASLDCFTQAKRGTTLAIRHQHIAGHVLPLISKTGRILPHALGVWKCRPNELLTTLVSTVFKRLQKQKWKRYKNKKVVSDHQLFKLAFIHVLFPLENYFDIGYGLFKNNPKSLSRYLYKILLSVDESIRFLFAQLSKSSSWVQHKASRPCNKSTRLSDFPCWRKPIADRLPSVEEAYYLLLRPLTSQYSLEGVKMQKASIVSLQGSQTFEIFTGNHTTAGSARCEN
jgi:hypothetical protein